MGGVAAATAGSTGGCCVAPLLLSTCACRKTCPAFYTPEEAESVSRKQLLRKCVNERCELRKHYPSPGCSFRIHTAVSPAVLGTMILHEKPEHASHWKTSKHVLLRELAGSFVAHDIRISCSGLRNPQH